MLRNRLSFTLTAMLFVCGSAWAVGKVTVDPNTPGAAGSISVRTTDTRVAQKVTYQARHTAVKNVLYDLTQMTGVKLSAGVNAQDWQVRDRKINIFAHDTTLAELMSSIARAMAFKWSISKDRDPWTYRLWMDRRSLADLQTKANQAEEGMDQRAKENRQTFVDWIKSGKKPSEAELQSMKENDPYRYLLYQRGDVDCLRAMFKEAPGLEQSFLDARRNMQYPISSLSSETQQLFLHVAQETCRLAGHFHQGGGEPLSAERSAKLLSVGVAGFELTPREHDYHKDQRDWRFGGMGASIEGEWVPIAELQDPDNTWTQVWAQVDVEAGEQGGNYDQLFDRVLKDKAGALSKSDAEHDTGEPLVEHPDEPALHVKISLDKCEDNLADLQAALAEASGLAVVSDSFRLVDGSASIGDSENELISLLNSVADGYHYNWEKHGSVIEFRNRDWFKLRSIQIPDEWVEGWEKDIVANGLLPLEDYAQIAWLNYDQLKENLAFEEVFQQTQWVFLHGDDLDFRGNIPLLKFYSSLDANKRKLLLSPGSFLPVGSFSPQQAELATKMLRVPQNAGGSELPIDAVFAASISDVPDGITRFKMDLLDADGKVIPTQRWSVTLPKYTPPPKVEQPSAKPGGAAEQKPAVSAPK